MVRSPGQILYAPDEDEGVVNEPPLFSVSKTEKKRFLEDLKTTQSQKTQQNQYRSRAWLYHSFYFFLGFAGMSLIFGLFLFFTDFHFHG